MVAASLESQIPVPAAQRRWPRRLNDAERYQIIERIDDLQFGIGQTYDLTLLSDDELCDLLAFELAACSTSSTDL
jgi:hypothetical protein